MLLFLTIIYYGAQIEGDITLLNCTVRTVEFWRGTERPKHMVDEGRLDYVMVRFRFKYSFAVERMWYTYETAKARFCPWLSGTSPKNLSSRLLVARKGAPLWGYTHAKPYVGVSRPRSWSHLLVLGAISWAFISKS